MITNGVKIDKIHSQISAALRAAMHGSNLVHIAQHPLPPLIIPGYAPDFTCFSFWLHKVILHVVLNSRVLADESLSSMLTFGLKYMQQLFVALICNICNLTQKADHCPQIMSVRSYTIGYLRIKYAVNKSQVTTYWLAAVTPGPATNLQICFSFYPIYRANHGDDVSTV